jgi:hypothetical protein
MSIVMPSVTGHRYCYLLFLLGKPCQPTTFSSLPDAFTLAHLILFPSIAAPPYIAAPIPALFATSSSEAPIYLIVALSRAPPTSPLETAEAL